MSKLHQLALTKIEGIGYTYGRQLLQHFGSEEAIFTASKKDLMQIPGIGRVTAEKIKKSKALEEAAHEWEYIEKNNVELIFCTDPKFPRRLKHCHDAPLLLYYKGNVDLNHQRIISVVGTRKASRYGMQLCAEMAAVFSGQNILVVSGLAFGIDISMHSACVQHQIPTIGVLAHGVDKIYPAAHHRTVKDMLLNGGVLSEFGLGTFPERENFPKRNRIIAGMADAVVVVEAAKKGGALITANLGDSYSRDVFAFPGRVGDYFSEGCNHLIKTNRAALVQSGQDILYYLGWDQKENPAKQKQQALPISLSDSESSIYQLLQAEPRQIDDLGNQLSMPQSQLSVLLLNMELQGIIQCLPGKLYACV